MNASEALVQVQRIREFQINDLRRADEKASTNFLVCIGCINATEVLGGIKTGLLGRNKQGDVTTRLKSGLTALGGVYQQHAQDLLDLRHSMVHAYLGKIRNYVNVDIANKGDPWASLLSLGVQIVNGRFVVNVSRWIEDLDNAWPSALAEIKANPEKASRLANVLEKLPTLR